MKEKKEVSYLVLVKNIDFTRKSSIITKFFMLFQLTAEFQSISPRIEECYFVEYAILLNMPTVYLSKMKRIEECYEN